VRRFRKGEFRQLMDKLAVNRRDREVEAGEIAMHRKFGGVHLVTHRAHRAVRQLGLQ
jgi:hypothetical protein